MKNKKLLFFLMLMVAFGFQLNAQGLFSCENPGTASVYCTESCINCDLNNVTGITNVGLPPWENLTLCHDDIVLERPRFFGFIAGSTDLSIAIFPSNCLNGDGLEATFLDGCTTTFGCLPGPNALNGFGSFIITATNLIVGHPYQLLIDGFNADICNFSLLVINGSTQGPPLGTIGAITGLTQVCPNGTANYTIAPVDNAVSYTWSGPAGSSINGGGNVRVLPATGNNNTISVEFGNTGGNICVTASNACSPQVTTCLPVSNVPVPPTQLPEEVICYGQIPYEWPEEPHTIVAAPGTYNLTSSPYLSYIGCDSIVKQKLIVKPLNQVNLPLRYLCKNECYNINGAEYCETGSYQEYLTSFNGCDSIVNFSLIKIPSKAVTARPDTITCAVTSVPLSGVGSTSGNSVTYRWLDPDGVTISNVITATANQPGVFALIVTNTVGGNACRDTAFVTVPGNLTPPQVDAGPDMLLTCNVTQVQLQGTGSIGADYTYFWKTLIGGNIVSGTTTLTPVVDAPGTYNLRITNNHNGCSAISNAVVDEDIAPPVVTTVGGTFTCSAPSITLQVATNAPNPGFAWTGPNNFVSTAQNPNVNVAGTYTVVVTNGNTGCTASATAVVEAGDDTPDLAVTGGGITCVESSVTLGATSTFQGITYLWTGPGGFSSTLPNPVVTVLGNYTLVVSAPNGCSNSAIATVSLNNTPPGTTLAASGSLNCNNTSINVLATSTGNPALLTHAWTLPGGGTQNTGAAAFLPATIPGVYTVLVNNTATGCTSTASFTVVQYANVTASIDNAQNPQCSDTNDGSLSLAPAGGNGVYTYVWSNGPTTAVNPNLGTGIYVATVTDGENCTATVSATITAPDPLNTNATATGQTGIGLLDGTATANPSGGTPGYTYLWSTAETTQSISGLAPGAYTVVVTDSHGCTSEKTVNVSQFNCTLQTELIAENISCFGTGNGVASLNFLGGLSPYVITWSTGDTDVTSVDSLPAGQYTVSITDAANCPEVQSFTITEPTVLLANATGSTTSGPGVDDGTASANPTGGTGTYTYSWSNAAITATISDLAAGLYTVTVSDENNCEAVQTVEVLAGNCSLTTNFQVTNPACNGAATGAATIVITGGNGNFTYLWSTGGTAATETGLTAGTHTVSVTDDNGCSIDVEVELTEPTAINVAVESTQVTSCPTAPEGSATVSATGGTGVLSVTWSDGQIGLTATGLIAGVYTAVATDENGCTSSAAAEIFSEDTQAPVITATNTTVPIGPDGNVLLTTLNMNATVTDNCNLASVLIEPGEFFCTQLGDHQVTITATDGAGLVTSQTITVTIVDDADPILICSPSLVLCIEDNPVSYQAPTATDNCLINGGMFNITEGLPIGAVFPIGSTTTTYTFTDAQGNVGTCSFEVTILSQLTVEVDTIFNDVNLQHIGSIFINVSGSLAPYTYSWTFNGQEISTSQNVTGLGAGDYTVVVTDDNGCTVASQVITVLNTTSGTRTPSALDGIQVFPNPTSGNLSVLLPDDLVGENVFLQVFDLTGRKVFEQTSLQDKQIDLTLLGLSDGLYSLVVRIDNNQVVRKIVVTK